MNARGAVRVTARGTRVAAIIGALLAAAPAFAATASGHLDRLQAVGAAMLRVTADPRSASQPFAAGQQAKGGGFDVPRQVIAGGGGTSSGGVFAVSGTIGQPDADPLQPSTGGAFAISGGFWPGTLPAPPAVDPLFADGFEPAAR